MNTNNKYWDHYWSEGRTMAQFLCPTVYCDNCETPMKNHEGNHFFSEYSRTIMCWDCYEAWEAGHAARWGEYE